MSAGAEPLLELLDVHAGYGPLTVLQGISMTVLPGEIVTVIGANGAGKTTTMQCCSGLLPIRQGSIRFAGVDLGRMAAHRIPALGLAQVPEGRRIFPRLTVAENLHVGGYLCRDRTERQQRMEQAFALFPVLAERRQQLGGTLSGGEQQMLALARALMTRPRLLIMDEPSMGVAPLVVRTIAGCIRDLHAQGLAVLLVEQNAHLALSLASRGYVMEHGRIVLSGSSTALRQDPRVQQAYLGE
jgi:branched-chain amino acid transport system ATP-binding protein